MKKRITAMLVLAITAFSLVPNASAWQQPPEKYSTFEEYLNFYRSCDDKDTNKLVAYIENALSQDPDFIENFDANAYFEANFAMSSMGITKENWLADNDFFEGYDFNSEMLNIYFTESYRAVRDEGRDFIASDWARRELARAELFGLIPERLDGADMTKSITRAEFAAICVKIYEDLAETTVVSAKENPFLDTADTEVLKAYTIGVVNGISESTFEPDAFLTREQAATMLARVFKKKAFDSWTLENDAQFPLNYIAEAGFSDSALISAWARDSVFFMAEKMIIYGMDDGTFSPQETTTREQALVIAARMSDNLGY